MTEASPPVVHTGLDLHNRILALAGRLEKEPRLALANVLAGEVLTQAAYVWGWKALDKVEADLMEKMQRWRKTSRLAALNKKAKRILDAIDTGKPLPKRRKANLQKRAA